MELKEHHKLLVVSLVLAMVICVCAAQESTMDRVQWEQEAYIVEKGDTLWGIGEKHCPDSVDIREWIEEVRKINELSDSCIYAGDRLIILVPQD